MGNDGIVQDQQMFIQIKCSYRESEDGGSANCGQKTAVERQTAATGKRIKRNRPYGSSKTTLSNDPI